MDHLTVSVVSPAAFLRALGPEAGLRTCDAPHTATHKPAALLHSGGPAGFASAEGFGNDGIGFTWGAAAFAAPNPSACADCIT